MIKNTSLSREQAALLDEEVRLEIRAMTYSVEATERLADPNFWHLNTDATGAAHFVDAWTVGSGLDVTISIVDEGINHRHADLIQAYDQLIDFDPRDADDNDAMVDDGNQSHGTRVAGLIAGDVDNDFGTVGGTQDSTITASYLRYGELFELADLEAILAQQKNYDVSNNSWGFTGAFADNFSSSKFDLIEKNLQSVVEEGREGLGTIFVVSAGNGRIATDAGNIGDDANFHNLTNSRFAIAVGAHDASGAAAIFSSPGANVLLTAPGVGLLTTDGSADGSEGSAYVSGTSFSAPLVSSAVALMLAENPDLGYRDVQEILALSSNARTGGGVIENGFAHFNGGGLMFSREGGFGLLDASAAVALARNWDRSSTFANEKSLSLSFDAPGMVDGSAVTLEAVLEDSLADDFAVDWVEVDLTIQDPNLRDLRIDLVSPDGTRVALAENFIAGGDRTYLSFTFSSVASWGENPSGVWSIEFSHDGGSTGLTIYQVDMRIFGDTVSADDVHFITSSFAALVEIDATRSTISDANSGIDTLNFAGGGSSVFVDLGMGQGTFQDVAFTLDGAFENVVGTTDDDRIVGSDADNRLVGDFGADTLVGGGGIDALFGGVGNDILDGGVGTDFMFGGEGDDTYLVDDTFDLVDEGSVVASAGSGGFDTIVSTANWFWDVYSVAERLVIAENAFDPDGFGTTIVGSANANEMIGNSATNVLFGRGGSDTYRAGDGVDFISLSTLGLTDDNAYVGVDGVNTVIVEQRRTGAYSYDIVYDFESGKDRIDVSDYAARNGFATAADVLALGVDDGRGNCYFALGDGFDYLQMVGLELADLNASDFII